MIYDWIRYLVLGLLFTSCGADTSRLVSIYDPSECEYYKRYNQDLIEFQALNEESYQGIILTCNESVIYILVFDPLFNIVSVPLESLIYLKEIK